MNGRRIDYIPTPKDIRKSICHDEWVAYNPLEQPRNNCKQAQKKQNLPSFARTLGGFFVLYNTLYHIAITAYFLL